MAVVTESLVQLIAKQVDDKGLVVWYDPEQAYGAVASELSLPNTTVAWFDGRFFRLRKGIDHLLNDRQAPRLVAYVPIERTETHSAVIELDRPGVLGRWDILLATGEDKLSELPDPFRPLPICPQGMSQRRQGRATKDKGQPTKVYPLSIVGEGALADDTESSDDVVRRDRDVIEGIWRGRADAIEKEARDILGVADLRDYFRKPGAGGFWDDHVKRYSKSRRKAPIYWLLQSSKKNYALWLYYHRLDKDLLFKALVNYVEPKIKLVLGHLSFVLGQIQSTKDQGPRTKDQKKLEKEAERLESLLSELRDFEDKLRRAANLHLEPDLNDGVVLNIAPLHELVPWKEAKKYWDELLEGKYEWSSIGKQLRQKGLIR